MISDYLNKLAYQSGICLSQEINESFNELLKWNIVEEEDKQYINEDLNYIFLYTTIGKLLEIDDIKSFIEDNKWISNRKDNDLVSEEEAINVINKAVHIINNPDIDNSYYSEENDVKHSYDYSYNEDILETNEEYEIGDLIFLEEDNVYKKIGEIYNDDYKLIDPEIDEVLNKLYIFGTNQIDFNDAEIIPYNDEIDVDNSNYINNNYELLASKRHTFNKDGFRVAYSFNSSGINVRVSKQNKDKLNMFFDVSLSNIKPTYKWKYSNGEIEDAFFKVNYKLTNELGVSTGKYNNYYLDFKDLDTSSFLNTVKSVIKPKNDEIDCTIPICKIKTPIPNVPFADFGIDVVLKIYTTGRAELVLYNNGIVGFEIKNGNFRVVHDVNNDIDFIVGGSARAVAGLNFNLEATNFRLMDLEFDAGVRAAVTTTMHLYDEEGNNTEVESDVPYSILQEISKENKDVRICGDVSLNWVFDIQLNTSKSILYKYGLTYKKQLLDSNDQVFNNLTHIENWQFVKKCTRKNRTVISTPTTTKLSSDRITLKKYSQVINIGETYEIPIVSIPNGYTNNDLVFYSNETSIATVNNGIVTGQNIGSTKIEIKTKDDKYKAYINILVSTG